MATFPSAAELWHTMSSAVQAGDLAAARDCVVDDFFWEVMGRFPYAGRYRGVEGLAQLFRSVREGTDGSFHMVPELSYGDEHAAVVVGHVTAARGAKKFEGDNIFLVRASGGHLTSGMTIPVDQYSYDEFWN